MDKIFLTLLKKNKNVKCFSYGWILMIKLNFSVMIVKKTDLLVIIFIFSQPILQIVTTKVKMEITVKVPHL